MLIAAVAHAEQELAVGRSGRLRAIGDSSDRLAAYVGAYLPDDRHDPGWTRSASRAEFTAVGQEADRGWFDDLVECLDHVTASGGTLPEPATAYARRFIFFLDGLAIHVLADHIGHDEALGYAMAELRDIA